MVDFVNVNPLSLISLIKPNKNFGSFLQSLAQISDEVIDNNIQAITVFLDKCLTEVYFLSEIEELIPLINQVHTVGFHHCTV